MFCFNNSVPECVKFWIVTRWEIQWCDCGENLGHHMMLGWGETDRKLIFKFHDPILNEIQADAASHVTEIQPTLGGWIFLCLRQGRSDSRWSVFWFLWSQIIHVWSCHEFLGQDLLSTMPLTNCPMPIWYRHRWCLGFHNSPDHLQFLWTKCLSVKSLFVCGDTYDGIDLREHRKNKPSQPLFISHLIGNAQKVSVAVC